MLLENCQGDSLVDVTALAGLDSMAIGATSAVWADLDLDSRVDLLVGWGGEVGTSTAEWTAYYLNQGEDASGQFTLNDVAGASTGPRIPKFGNVNAIDLADVTGDGKLDILCAADSTSAVNNLLVWISDGSGAFSAAPDSLGLRSPTEFIDIEIADLTGNGVLDVVAVPVAADTIEVFVGFGGSSDRSYDDVFDEAELGDDRAYGVVAADFNRDSDSDLFLLRPESGSSQTTADEKFFWANGAVDQADPPDRAKFFTIAVTPDNSLSTNPNTLATGAIITSTVVGLDGETLKTTQLVDGGSGRGSQGARRLIFGFGGAEEADVTVRWPHGAEEEFEVSADSVDVDGFVHEVFVDTSNPTIVPSLISASYTLNGNQAIHKYTWTTRHRADAAKVRVNSQATECDAGLGGNSTILLDPDTMPAVTWTQTQDGDDWDQEVVWSTACAANCDYKYKVKSLVGGTTYTGAEKTLSIGACVIIIP